VRQGKEVSLRIGDFLRVAARTSADRGEKRHFIAVGKGRLRRAEIVVPGEQDRVPLVFEAGKSGGVMIETDPSVVPAAISSSSPLKPLMSFNIPKKRTWTRTLPAILSDARGFARFRLSL